MAEGLRVCGADTCAYQLLTSLNFSFLVDQGILSVTNRWRKERGETEINLGDLGIAEPAFSAEG